MWSLFGELYYIAIATPKFTLLLQTHCQIFTHTLAHSPSQILMHSHLPTHTHTRIYPPTHTHTHTLVFTHPHIHTLACLAHTHPPHTYAPSLRYSMGPKKLWFRFNGIAGQHSCNVCSNQTKEMRFEPHSFAFQFTRMVSCSLASATIHSCFLFFVLHLQSFVVNVLLLVHQFHSFFLLFVC